ncbi:MAG: hypothetical protein IT374_06375 [Polyangiaceae bacterium]|nr:hypothetical protein [Polyangiaceae bacterium]
MSPSPRPRPSPARAAGLSLIAALALVAGACEDGEGGGLAGGAKQRAPVDLGVFACPGAPAVGGVNTVEVGGVARSFHVQLPRDTSRPLPVVFSWHGYNDPGSDGDAAGWRGADQLDADADPSFPVIVVTPLDADFDIPVGLDWQLDQGRAPANADLAFFEAMMGCLHAGFEVDPARVYSYGFSAGSVMTSLLHSAYPGLFSAVVCASGMWFNDPAEVALIKLITVTPSWPALDPRDGGAVLLTHGGPKDATVLNVANLEDMAQAAFPFLKAGGRIVVDCPHDHAHALHPGLSAAHVLRFFAAHRAGQSSPLVAGPLAGFPEGCAVRLP